MIDNAEYQKKRKTTELTDHLTRLCLENIEIEPVAITKDEMIQYLASYIKEKMRHCVDGYEMATLFDIYFKNC